MPKRSTRMFSAYYNADDDTSDSPYPNSGSDRPQRQYWPLHRRGQDSRAIVGAEQYQILRFDGSERVSVQLPAERRPPLYPAGRPNPERQADHPRLSRVYRCRGIGTRIQWRDRSDVPALEGVPAIEFAQELSGTNIGVPADTPKQFNNTFEWQDNFSKVLGTHSLKFGGQFHYDQINDRNLYGENGVFSFSGSETNSDFTDFLIGAPSGFIQATQQILDSRSKYLGLYAQDSWRVTPNLTLNYGLRWEFSMPWYDTQGKIETLIPGKQSVLFPGAPTGWVVPGDPGVPKTLAPTQYHNLSPRVGVAYSPGGDSGFLAKLTGGPGKTSIRVGYGIFYTSVEDLTQFQEIGDAPFGLFFATENTFLEQPFTDRGTGVSTQRFPFAFPPLNVSARNPDTTFNWAEVEPISGSLAFEHTNVTPYAEHYEFSLQRQFGSNTVLSVSYVGTQAHHLLTSVEANPASAALCEQLIADGASPQCGPFGEASVYTLPPGAPFPAAAQANPAVELTGQPCQPFSGGGIVTR